MDLLLVALFFLVPITVVTIVCHIGYLIVRWWLDAWRAANAGLDDSRARARRGGVVSAFGTSVA